MATLGSKLQTKKMEWMANMTEQNHLGKALLTKPHVFEGAMNTLFSAQRYSDNPLSTMLMNTKGGEKTISGTEYEWQLKGANTRPLVCTERVEPVGNTAPGKFRREFKLKLDENWFLPGDVIHPGTSNKKYQVRIQETPFRQGDGWIYTVRLMSDDPQAFVDEKYLEPGTQWAKLYAQYAEAATRGGSTQFSLPISYRNRIHKMRKQYEITDYASTEVLAVNMFDSKGGKHSSWMKYAEVEYWEQWYRELERNFWYSRSTDTVLDDTGRPLRTGPGVQEQLEDSHIHRYTHLTAKLIEEYLMDIFYSRVKPGQGRHIKAYTGEYGMLAFHRAIQSEVDRRGFVQNVEFFQNGVKSDYHMNALGYGYQYVKYSMANGSTLELIHNPLYDDREINFEIDPVTGKPVESQRFTFLDFSDVKDSNIQIVSKEKGSAFTYVEGLYGPYGPKKSGTSAHSKESYEMHVSKVCGVHIKDVTRCGELILTRG